MAKAPTMEQSAVLDWLLENQPELFAVAETDRSWVWLPVDLRGCGIKKCECDICTPKRATRAAIKEIGFRWAKNGHPLESGAVGTWAHHCDRPIPYRRKGGGGKEKEGGERRERTISDLDAEIMAALG